MTNESLSGIEREIVLQYLMDGNVPVTLTPLEQDGSDDAVHSPLSQIFPIALKSERIRVEKDGRIQLDIPQKSVPSFEGKNTRVEFYFNRIGLYFEARIERTKDVLAITIPEEIHRIKEENPKTKYDFSAELYHYSRRDKNGGKSISCIPWQKNGQEEAGSPLFSRPVWKSIPLENQKRAKAYLEEFVENAKLEKNAGTGIQLIPICNYLTSTEQPQKLQALQEKTRPAAILYIDHERIVLGSNEPVLVTGEELKLLFSFSIKNSPILSRDMYVDAIVNKIYTSRENSRGCVDCVFTGIQEEDLRFLYEKATKMLFV